METKHTPGPWRTGTPYATGGNQCRRVRIVGGDNWPDEEDIAVVGGGLASPCDANARLIAAAPELLEALKKVAQSLEWRAHGCCRGIDDDGPLPTNEAVELAKHTIAKAIGHDA